MLPRPLTQAIDYSYRPSNYTGPVPDILPNLSTPAGIGIVIAISGNVVISLALNLQKLAHRKVELARARKSKEQQDISTSNGEPRPISLRERGLDLATITDEDSQYGARVSEEPEDVFSSQAETQHLLAPMHDLRRNYSNYSEGSASLASRYRGSKPTFLSRLFSFPKSNSGQINSDRLQQLEDPRHSLRSVDGSTPSLVVNGRQGNGKPGSKPTTLVEGGNESDYLRSKIWWVHQIPIFSLSLILVHPQVARLLTHERR